MDETTPSDFWKLTVWRHMFGSLLTSKPFQLKKSKKRYKYRYQRNSVNNNLELLDAASCSIDVTHSQMAKNIRS